MNDDDDHTSTDTYTQLYIESEDKKCQAIFFHFTHSPVVIMSSNTHLFSSLCPTFLIREQAPTPPLLNTDEYT